MHTIPSLQYIALHCIAHKGHTTAEINEVITKEHDMKVILWSLDAHDAVEKDPARIVVAVVRRAKPGDVILLHDINPHTAEALPTIIDKLHEQGYEFLTISEIMSFPDDSPH
jgi:peptidoglycan/xylan/chitin deacetylase (PgdA/CDA1 family)